MRWFVEWSSCIFTMHIWVLHVFHLKLLSNRRHCSSWMKVNTYKCKEIMAFTIWSKQMNQNTVEWLPEYDWWNQLLEWSNLPHKAIFLSMKKRCGVKIIDLMWSRRVLINSSVGVWSREHLPSWISLHSKTCDAAKIKLKCSPLILMQSSTINI